MKLRTKTVILPLITALAVSLGVAIPGSAMTYYDGVQAARGDGVPGTLSGDGGIITTVVNTLLFIVGVISVIMLIVGGLRYVISGGNSTQVSAAKNTILYAVIGLLIAVFAFAIVNFVLDAVTGAGGIGGGGGGNNIPPTDK